MSKELHIASVGDNCIDIYINADHKICIGGNAVNTAVAVQRSGVQCSYVGMVGDDVRGGRVKSELASEGIDVTHLRSCPGETAYTEILLENNDRIPVAENIGVQRKYDISPEELAFIASHDFAHLSAFTAWPSAEAGDMENYYGIMRKIFYSLATLGTRTSVDFSLLSGGTLLEICRDKVEVGFFSRSGLSKTALENEAKRLFEYGFRVVILTRGVEGSCAYDGNAFTYQSIVPVTLVDPLGAGDSFIGAFLTKYVAGKSLTACLQYAAWYAAQVCTRYGGF